MLGRTRQRWIPALIPPLAGVNVYPVWRSAYLACQSLCLSRLTTIFMQSNQRERITAYGYVSASLPLISGKHCSPCLSGCLANTVHTFKVASILLHELCDNPLCIEKTRRLTASRLLLQNRTLPLHLVAAWMHNSSDFFGTSESIL